MSYSNYLEDAINNAVCAAGSLSIAAVYIKLHIGDPGETGTGNPAANTTRKIVTFGASSGGTSTSNADASWVSVSNTEQYQYVSLWDNLTVGNCLGSGALTVPKDVNAGDTFTIASGSLTFTSS